MHPFTGKFVRAGQVVADGVSGRLDASTGAGGEVYWSGFALVPGEATVNLDDVFDLVLDDGRSSTIKIERVNQTPAGVSVSFAPVR